MGAVYTFGEGRVLSLDRAGEKLSLRARLPGAALFDRAAHALRQAHAAGVPLAARLDLALASSWLVNSPATSPRLRALASPPHAEALLALAEHVDGLPDAATEDDDATTVALVEALGPALGSEQPRAAEILSKILALIAPHAVPLLPAAACAHLLDVPPTAQGERFARAVGVFRAATLALYPGLVEVARAHEAAVLDAAQVADRLIWFDSEGYRHFPSA